MNSYISMAINIHFQLKKEKKNRRPFRKIQDLTKDDLSKERIK